MPSDCFQCARLPLGCMMESQSPRFLRSVIQLFDVSVLYIDRLCGLRSAAQMLHFANALATSKPIVGTAVLLFWRCQGVVIHFVVQVHVVEDAVCVSAGRLAVNVGHGACGSTISMVPSVMLLLPVSLKRNGRPQRPGIVINRDANLAELVRCC